MVREQRYRVAADSGELRIEPVELLGLARQSGVHDQRIESDEIPAGGLKLPAVFAEKGEKTLPVALGDRLRRSRTDLRRVVPDVMTAAQLTTIARNRTLHPSP